MDYLNCALWKMQKEDLKVIRFKPGRGLVGYPEKGLTDNYRIVQAKFQCKQRLLAFGKVSPAFES